ncbi:hypothetical protein ACHAPJ_013081 [Fusarium lateritium]
MVAVWLSNSSLWKNVRQQGAHFQSLDERSGLSRRDVDTPAGRNRCYKCLCVRRINNSLAGNKKKTASVATSPASAAFEGFLLAVKSSSGLTCRPEDLFCDEQMKQPWSTPKAAIVNGSPNPGKTVNFQVPNPIELKAATADIERCEKHLLTVEYDPDAVYHDLQTQIQIHSKQQAKLNRQLRAEQKNLQAARKWSTPA